MMSLNDLKKEYVDLMGQLSQLPLMELDQRKKFLENLKRLRKNMLKFMEKNILEGDAEKNFFWWLSVCDWFLKNKQQILNNNLTGQKIQESVKNYALHRNQRFNQSINENHF